jgi:DNA-binding transcriptional ArsR family regulator
MTDAVSRFERLTAHHDPSLDDAVRAIGHPGRRAMLRLVRDAEHTAAELAAAAGLSAPAASQHLKLLRDTGLLDVRVDAQRRRYRANLARLAEVRAELDDLWSDRLDRLRAAAEAAPADDSSERPA